MKGNGNRWLALALLSLGLAGARAGDIRFNHAGPDDDWTTAENWLGGTVPGPEDNALFNYGGQVGRLTTEASVNALRLGVDGQGGLIIDGGTLETTGGWNALGANSAATLTIINGGTFTNNDWFSVGFGNTMGCSVTIDDGTLHASGGYFHNLYFDVEGSATDARTTLNSGALLSAGFLELKSGVMDIAGGTLVVRRDAANLIKSYIADGRMIAMGGAPGWIPKVSVGEFNWTTVVAGPIPGATVLWRVIPDDAQFPTRDVVLAAVSVTDEGFTTPLPADPANEDCTATFLEAIEVTAAAGGGSVFVPAGQYRIDGRLNIPTGVSLRGQWKKPEPGEPVSGTLLKAYAGRNDEGSAPFIGLHGDAAVRDLAIWYPEQMPDAIVPYPPTIQALNGGGHVVENVTFVNAYTGFTIYQAWGSMGGGDSVRGLYGTPLKLGLEFDQMAEVGRVESVSFSPEYWKGSGLPDSPTANEHAAWIKANGTGVIVRRIDWSYFAYVAVDGYHIGLACRPTLTPDSDSSPNGQFYGFDLLNCQTGIHLEDFAGAGVQFSRFNIENAEVGVFSEPNQGADAAMFQTCTIEASDRAVRSLGSTIYLFQNCDFVSGGIKVDNDGELSVLNCDFGAISGNHLELGMTVQATLVGNRFAGGRKIANGSLRVVHVDDQPLALADVPEHDFATPEMDFKPGTSNLYVVTEAPYNAAGDGVADDTAAFQAALTDAASGGGGTVLAPAGDYRINGNLVIPPGVELRGACDFPHGPRSFGTVLNVHDGRNQENGTPFIQLQPGSGIRGLTFHYPEQVFDAGDADAGMVPYPFMIRGLGAGVHVIDIGVTIPWQLLDLATTRCDNHFVDAVFGTALKTGITVGNGSSNGRIQNCLFNPSSYAFSYGYYDSIPSGVSFSPVYDLVARQAEGYVMGHTVGQVFYQNFVFGGLRGVTMADEGGVGPQGWALGLGVDQCVTALQIDALGSGGFDCINNQLVTVNPTEGHYIATGSNLAGIARIFGVATWGRSNESIVVDGGQLNLQAFHNNAPGEVTFDVNGSGVLRNQGASIYKPATTFLDQEAGATVEITGVIANVPEDQMPKSSSSLTAIGNLCGGIVAPTPPAGPSGLVVTPGAGGTNLDWSDNSESDLNSYNVWRSAAPGGDLVQIASRLKTSAYLDTDVIEGETWHYQVTAVDVCSAESGAYVTPVNMDRSGWVVTASVGTPANAIDGNPATRWSTNGPQAPGQWFQVDLGMTREFSRLVLDAGSSVNDYPRGYQVDVSNDGIDWGSPVAVGSGNSAVTLISIARQTARYIRITQTGSTTGNYWSIHEFNIVNFAPVAPAGLTATPGPSEVNLVWTASAGAATYQVKRSIVDGGPYETIAGPTATSYHNPGLSNGTTYYYVVTAVGAGGESGDSLQADATPAGTTFDTWAQGWGVDIGSETDDYDGDSRSNLYEYALGGNPTDAADVGTAPTLVEGAGVFTFSHLKRNTDANLAYVIEQSPDLIFWSAADSELLETSAAGGDFDQAVYGSPMSGEKLFIRLRIGNP